MKSIDDIDHESTVEDVLTKENRFPQKCGVAR